MNDEVFSNGHPISKAKVGDQVRVVDKIKHDCGKTYLIKHIRRGKIYFLDNRNFVRSYFVWRFELIIKNKRNLPDWF